jgi:peptidoglycan-associated lipoprotein
MNRVPETKNLSACQFSKVWSIVVFAGCAALSACQRPGQELPDPPMFTVPAAPPAARPSLAPPPGAAYEPFRGATVILFDNDSTSLTESARSALDEQAEWLLGNPAVTAVVAGHADLFGSRARQFAIGEMRANAMRRYLVSRGVSPNRLIITSFGKQQPITTARDEASQRRNRRGETTFLGMAGLSRQ